MRRRTSSGSALVPAAAITRPETRLTPEEADLSAAAIETFATAVGGRDALARALIVADAAPEVSRIVDLLIDPRYADFTVRRLCRDAGLTVVELFAAYKKALFVRAHLDAARAITSQLVGVVDDVMKRAQPYPIDCPRCQGVGQVTSEPTKDAPNPSPQVCDTCRGGGKLLQLPDLDRQKLALELGQLVAKSGVSIAFGLQQNLHLPASPGGGRQAGALEALQQAVGEILYPRPGRAVEPPVDDPVDGTVVGADTGDACDSARSSTE